MPVARFGRQPLAAWALICAVMVASGCGGGTAAPGQTAANSSGSPQDPKPARMPRGTGMASASTTLPPEMAERARQLAEEERQAAEDAANAASGDQTEITLVTADETEFQRILDEHKGKVVLVDFWATWCHPCTKNFPHAVTLHNQYKDAGLVVISVSVDDPEETQNVKDFLAERKATFINLQSAYGSEEKSFELFDLDGGSVPHYRVYGRDGNLVKKFYTDPTERAFEMRDVDAVVLQALGVAAADSPAPETPAPETPASSEESPTEAPAETPGEGTTEGTAGSTTADEAAPNE